MEVTLTMAECIAVNQLRGLPPAAHMLIMCSLFTATGGILEGSKGDFDDLLGFISEEVADGRLSDDAVRALVSLCIKIDPGSADWLGM